MRSGTRRTGWLALGACLSLVAAACAPLSGSTDDLASTPRHSSTAEAPRPSTPSGSFTRATTKANIAGCPVFPPDHFLNARNIDELPVHPKSSTWTQYLARDGHTLRGPNHRISPDGARSGMPINVVDSRTLGFKSVLLNPSYAANNYWGPYPIPEEPRIQGFPSAQWDKHLLIVDVADCTAYELIQYNPVLHLVGIHTALAGTAYKLDSTAQPLMTTNVANTPMIGQYAMIEEVLAGELAHVIGFCTDQAGPGSVWPARKSDGTGDAAKAPPMGAWMRLRGDVDLKRFTGQARTIAEGLREHGMVLTDTCGHQFRIQSENSSRWSTEVEQLEKLTARDFEFVDVTQLRQSTTSFAVRSN